MTDLYITYGIRERYWASRLVASLESEGYSVFWDHAATPGDHVRHDSQHALEQAKCTLVIWSETSVDDHWVLSDSKQAMEKGALVSVLAPTGKVPQAYQSTQTVDLSDWVVGEKHVPHLSELLKTMKVYCEPSQLSAVVKEQQAIDRLERMRAETERKIKARELREARMISRRMSV